MKSVFENNTEARNHAAERVAKFWLESAEAILKRGDKPMPLSRCAKQYAVEELDREIYNSRRRWLDSGWIATDAISIARQCLLLGQYPTVRAHFTHVSDERKTSVESLS